MSPPTSKSPSRLLSICNHFIADLEEFVRDHAAGSLQTLDDFDAIVTWNLLENTSTRRHKAYTSGLGWGEDFESTLTHIHNNTKIARNKGRALDIL